jgi:hypothetical protein
MATNGVMKVAQLDFETLVVRSAGGFVVCIDMNAPMLQ